jgi:hypothetical protein
MLERIEERRFSSRAGSKKSMSAQVAPRFGGVRICKTQCGASIAMTSAILTLAGGSEKLQRQFNKAPTKEIRNKPPWVPARPFL